MLIALSKLKYTVPSHGITVQSNEQGLAPCRGQGRQEATLPLWVDKTVPKHSQSEPASSHL